MTPINMPSEPAEQPWPEVERWPIVSRRLSSVCRTGSHPKYGGFLVRDGLRQGARCACPCHTAQHPERRPVRARAFVLTDLARRDLAEMRNGAAS